MKYFAASTLLVAGAAAQSSFDIASAISALTASASGIASDASAYSGDSSKLESDNSALVSQIEKDDTSVKAISSIDPGTAAGLAAPVQSLGAATKQAVDAIVAKKSEFVSNGQANLVEAAFVAQASAAAQLSNDIVARVPAEFSSLASSLAAPISSYLASGAAAFSGLSGSASATSSGSASSSAGASTTASSSASTEPVTGTAPVSTPTGSSNATVTSSPPTTTSGIATGAANTLSITSGAAALSLLAVLAL